MDITEKFLILIEFFYIEHFLFEKHLKSTHIKLTPHDICPYQINAEKRDSTAGVYLCILRTF